MIHTRICHPLCFTEGLHPLSSCPFPHEWGAMVVLMAAAKFVHWLKYNIGDKFVPCWQEKKLSSATLSVHNRSQHENTDIRFSHTNKACHFTVHTALVTVWLLTVFILFALQPMKLGEHLNSLLLNMCDDVTLSRMSLRTVLDICSKHIRNSSCDPPFSYIRKLVRLVLGSLSQVCSFFKM